MPPKTKWLENLETIKLDTNNTEKYIDDIRTYYENEMEKIKNNMFRHRISSSGKMTCYRISRLAEEILKKVYKDVLEGYGYDEQTTALVAVGGFGRRELDPYSDIDILFLQHKKFEEESSEFIKRVLYILWDVKFHLGQSARTVKNCIKAAVEDITFKTSITNHVFLIGNRELYEDFKKAENEIFKKNMYSYYNNIVIEPQIEIIDFGRSVLIKEPDIKESRGGLRSIHTVLWLAKCFLDIGKLSEMFKTGFISKKEYHSLIQSYDYMLFTRNLLHFSVGRKQDILTSELQEQVVREYFKLFHEKNLRKNVEQFMRNYYKHSKNIYLISLSIIEKFNDLAEDLKVLPKKKKREKIDSQFTKIADTLYFRKEVEPDLKTLFKIFLITVRKKVKFSNEIMEYISKCLVLINEETRMNKELFSMFRNILKHERNLYYTLTMMHITGFLNKYIPYFENMDCLAQHDFYHKYTLDEHHLQCIKHIENLYSDKSKNLSYYRKVLLRIQKKDILIFTLLTHDYGKIWTGDHVDNARKTIDTLIETYPFTEGEKVLIAFLIINHLLLSRTSQRRDFNEIKTLAKFADKVGSIEKLELLFLFTYADVKGVGEGIFNNWKSSLMQELFYKAYILLNESEQAASKYVKLREEEVGGIKTKLLKRVNEEDDFKNFMDKLPDSYFVEMEEDDVIKHYNVNKERKEGEIKILAEKQKDYYSVYTIADDKSGLFSVISGIFAANGVIIMDASIYTGDLAINYLDVSHLYSGPVEDYKWDRLEKELNRAINGEMGDIEDFIKSRRKNTDAKSKSLVPIKTKVVFEKSLDGYTIMEIDTKDRKGLLHIISNEVAKFKFSIYLAKITTFGIRAVDIFYIKNKKGELLTLQECHDLEQVLLDKLN